MPQVLYDKLHPNPGVLGVGELAFFFSSETRSDCVGQTGPESVPPTPCLFLLRGRIIRMSHHAQHRAQDFVGRLFTTS